MILSRWIRRHRVLAAFLAGVLLTLAALAGTGYWVLSDQRRSARALARGLSRALAREVRIERVTDIGTERVVMRGVELPREGGWPATVVAERVEATGPLLAAARGDAAPLRLTVTRPAVEIGSPPRPPAAGPPAGRGRPPGAPPGSAPPPLRGRGTARGELTLREGQAPPLT